MAPGRYWAATAASSCCDRLLKSSWKECWNGRGTVVRVDGDQETEEVADIRGAIGSSGERDGVEG